MIYNEALYIPDEVVISEKSDIYDNIIDNSQIVYVKNYVKNKNILTYNFRALISSIMIIIFLISLLSLLSLILKKYMEMKINILKDNYEIANFNFKQPISIIQINLIKEIKEINDNNQNLNKQNLQDKYFTLLPKIIFQEQLYIKNLMKIDFNSSSIQNKILADIILDLIKYLNEKKNFINNFFPYTEALRSNLVCQYKLLQQVMDSNSSTSKKIKEVMNSNSSTSKKIKEVMNSNLILAQSVIPENLKKSNLQGSESQSSKESNQAVQILNHTNNVNIHWIFYFKNLLPIIFNMYSNSSKTTSKQQIKNDLCSIFEDNKNDHIEEMIDLIYSIFDDKIININNEYFQKIISSPIEFSLIINMEDFMSHINYIYLELSIASLMLILVSRDK